MIEVLVTLIITQMLIVGWYYISSKLYLKQLIENKIGKKIKFRDIK
ncbi:hypothetical protein ACTFJW_16920 [Clostridium cagae]